MGNFVSDPRNSGEFIKNQDNGRKPSQENVSRRKQQTSSETNQLAKDEKSRQMKRQEPVTKLNKPSSTNIGSGRPPKHDMEQKPNIESKPMQKSDKMTVLKKPLSSQQDVSAM